MNAVWKYAADIRPALEAVSGAITRAEGSTLETAVGRLSTMMEDFAIQAFSRQRDPRTNRAWDAPAPATTADPRFRSLMRRSGELAAAVRGQYRVGRAIGTAGLSIDASNAVIRRGMVHLYGVKARAKRANRTNRHRPGAVLPARRFVGFPKAAYAEIIDRLKRDLVGER